MKPGNTMGDAQKKMGTSFQRAMSEMAVAMEAIQLIQLQVENSVQGCDVPPEQSFPNMQLSQYETLRHVAEAEAMLEYLEQHPELKAGLGLQSAATGRARETHALAYKDGFIAETEPDPVPRPPRSRPVLGAGLAARVNQTPGAEPSDHRADPFHALEAQSQAFDLHLQRLADELERYR